MDTTPGNTDTHGFPAKPAKWQYRAIYHAGDSRVGEWSNPVSVTVGGQKGLATRAASNDPIIK